MADPISLGLLGVGTLFGAVSSIGSAQAQAASLQAQTNAANYNAELYQQQAQNTMAQSVANSNLQANRAEQSLARQRAATAESGVGFDGTAGDLIDQSAVNAELDRQNTLYSGMLNASSLNSQADQSTYQAQVAQSQINPTIAGGYIGATGNILSGVGGYMGYNRRMTSAGGGYYNSAAISSALSGSKF
ncbi:MAG: hypothetical protein E6Q33_02750 [Neisseriales bacterium]|nr:MAG: hypothetical protein E6Q33_02750 [Neisseriales bacterium]